MWSWFGQLRQILNWSSADLESLHFWASCLFLNQTHVFLTPLFHCFYYQPITTLKAIFCHSWYFILMSSRSQEIHDAMDWNGSLLNTTQMLHLRAAFHHGRNIGLKLTDLWEEKATLCLQMHFSLQIMAQQSQGHYSKSNHISLWPEAISRAYGCNHSLCTASYNFPLPSFLFYSFIYVLNF